jgi:hypothetical protein
MSNMMDLINQMGGIEGMSPALNLGQLGQGPAYMQMMQQYQDLMKQQKLASLLGGLGGRFLEQGAGGQALGMPLGGMGAMGGNMPQMPGQIPMMRGLLDR